MSSVTTLAHDVSGTGPLFVLLPGAGDLRSEHRLLAPLLERAGYRVAVADLPGHGDSPTAERYGVRQTADSLVALIEELGDGPAVVVGCSFAPAAAMWAASERPDLIRGLVAISPHVTEEGGLAASVVRVAMGALLRGALAAPMWARFYRGWYKTNPPADLDTEIAALRTMLANPRRRRAVRLTLTADRQGLDARIGRITAPTLVVFGTADDHFPDPVAEARELAGRFGTQPVLVEGAGHYPHVENPTKVAAEIVGFFAEVR